MLVVIPVCEKDAELAIRNIEHCLTLDGKCEFKAIVATERSFDSQPVLDAAARYFSGVDHCVYEDYKGDPQWPRPQNYAWQNVARWIEQKYRTPWFWWEQDAIVLKPGAFATLAYAHKQGGRDFAGAVTQLMGQFYLAGVAIYPWNISTYAVNALLTQAEAWDKMGSVRDGVLRRTHDISPLICHVPDRGNVHFKTHKDLERQIPETAVIFHKCKDGSLLDVLQNKEGTSDELDDEGKPSAQSGGKSSVLYPSFTEQTKYPCGYFTFPTPLHLTCYYNCSLAEHMGSRYLFTRRHRHRIYDPSSSASDNCSDLAIWKIRPNMTLESTPTLPLLPQRHRNEQWEDPRAVSHDGTLYLSFSNWVHNQKWPGRQSFTRLSADWRKVEVVWEPNYGNNASKPENGTGWEKNWIWFPHEEWWHCIYSIEPHVVFKVNADGTPVQTFTNKPITLPWEHGEIRGGTPPIKISDDEYLCFFHSCVMWQKPKRRYFMGAYTFSTKAPFEIKRITPTPILAGSELDYRVLGSPLVIFPNGALPDYDEKGVLEGFTVVFGVNDENCGWLKMPWKDLENSMVKVKGKKKFFSSI